MKFNEMNLNEKIVIALDAQSITEPTEIQANCIPLIMAGNDVIGRSQTGSGKTFAFGIPAIECIDTEERGVQVLVVSPTRELAVQTTEEMRKLTNQIEGCKVVPIYGGASLERQIMALKKGARIVVGTPGRIIDHINRKTLKLNKIKLVVLDEADEMLNMGFREDMEDILKFTPAERQTVMFSATMPKPILEITKNYMKNPQLIEVGVDNRPIETISQKFLYVAKQYKREALLHLFYTLKPKISLIFCNTKRMVDDLSKFMYANGFKVEGLHGDMRQGERKRVMDKMRSQEIDVLIATDVAARGIDINDIETVFNYDIPQNIDYYIHRIGRTGRAGKSGQAYTIISDKYQFSDLDDIQTTTKIKIEEYICEYSVGIKRTAKPKKLSVDMPEDTQPKEENAKAEQISSKPNADRHDEILEFNKAMTDFDSRTRPRGRGAFGRKPTGARQSAGGRSDNRSSDRRTSASSDRSSDRKPSGSSNYRGNREDKPAYSSDRSKFNREKPAYNREDKPAYNAEKREYKPRLNEDGSPAERTFKPREERSYDRKPSDNARSYDRKPSGSSNYRGNREDKPAFSSDRPKFNREKPAYNREDKPAYNAEKREYKPRLNEDGSPAERTFKPREERSYDRKPSDNARSYDRKPSGSSNYRGNREDKPAFSNDRPKFNREKPAYNREDKPTYNAEKREYKPRLNEDGSPAERTFKPREERSYDRKPSDSARSYDRKPSGSSNYRGNREDKPAFSNDRPKFNREKPAYNREDKPAYNAEKREYKPRLNEDGSPAEKTFKPREERSYDRKPSGSSDRSFDKKTNSSKPKSYGKKPSSFNSNGKIGGLNVPRRRNSK